MISERVYASECNTPSNDQSGASLVHLMIMSQVRSGEGVEKHRLNAYSFHKWHAYLLLCAL